MKDIVTYINEVSKGLVQKAYNKATGAQKNRIKALYKEIYGSDVAKSDVSNIKFVLDNKGDREDYYGIYTDNDLIDIVKEELSYWNQNILDKIKEVHINADFSSSGESVSINIDNKKYWYEGDYGDEDDNEVYSIYTTSNIKAYNKKNLDGYDTFRTFIARIYKEKYNK